MSEYTYTAEDFEQAEFAIDPSEDHPLARRWVRFFADDDLPWKNGHGVWRTSADMAAEHCIPVYAEPYSQEALRRAWEHGVQGRVGPGDVVMVAPPGGGFIVDVIHHEDETAKFARVIRRAPGPEPDPSEVERRRNRDAIYSLLCDLPDTMDIDDDTLDGWAGTLAEYGVRVVTDGE